MMPCTLLLTCAGESTRFGAIKSPKWLLTHPEGLTIGERSIEGLCGYDRLVVVCQKKHTERLLPSFKKRLFHDVTAAHITWVLLESTTPSQMHTVSIALEKANVRGAFAIKDCDNRFSFDLNMASESNAEAVVALCSVGAVSHLHNAAEKSYALLNPSDGTISKIAEKRVISSTFCCGLYWFASPRIFLSAWRRAGKPQYASQTVEEMPVSQRRGLLLAAKDYEDYGTAEAWAGFCALYANLFIDIDGVLFENGGRITRPEWGKKEQKPLSANIAWLKIKKPRARVYLCTARPEERRAETEGQLYRAGIPYDSLLMGLFTARRTLIADHGQSIPPPAVRAISINRNGNILEYI